MYGVWTSEPADTTDVRQRSLSAVAYAFLCCHSCRAAHQVLNRLKVPHSLPIRSQRNLPVGSVWDVACGKLAP